MESLLLLTEYMSISPKIADMSSRAILCFGGDDSSNVGGTGQHQGRCIFNIVPIGRVDDNNDCFEDMDYNKPIYNVALSAPANTPDLLLSSTS